MEKRPLGNTGIAVSVLGLGTVKFGRNQDVKYPNAFSIPDDKDIQKLLGLAQDLGINLLDTAPSYGNSEERLGKLLKNHRQDWVIVTKVGEEYQEGISTFNFSKEHTEMSIKRSLKRLKTDYLDAVLVHSDGNDVYNIEHFGILKTLATLKQQGYIRSFGMSTKTVAGGMLTLAESDIAMVTYNPIDTTEHSIIQQAHTLNKGILIKKALASGHIEKIPGKDPIQTSLQFILKEPAVSSIILGTIQALHLKHNVACLTRD